MAKKRRLIIVVEGTPAMGLHWRTVFSVYLRNMIRRFCGDGLGGQTCSAANIEMSLVVFKVPGSCDCLVQRSGWTKDVNVFLHWLTLISFTDGGFADFGDPAIGEGLSEALMMFSLVPNGGQVHNHCILVGASNPYPFATPVYRPRISKLDQSDEAESYLADAEMVAKTFAQCFISLSVISPNQLPKLKAIYDAGKSNSGAAIPSVDTIENPQFLILISETFKEACAELSYGEKCTAISHGTVIPHPIPGMSQGNLSGKIGQSGVGMNQNIMNGLGASNISSGAGTMMPTPGMSQQGQAGMQPLGVPNSSTTNMPLPKETSGAMQSGAPDKYARVWEGALSGERQGQPVFITKLEGYRSASASETLAADWPPMLHIVRLISEGHMHNKQYVGKADFLVFRALNQHGFLGQIQEKKLCAVIQLPSQTLLLTVSDKTTRLIGMLFPGDMVVFTQATITNAAAAASQVQQEQEQQHQQSQTISRSSSSSSNRWLGEE